MNPALAFILLVAAGALAGWAATRAIRSHHRRQAANRITRARARARLPEQMHLLGRDHDTQPAPVDNLTHQLEALYHAPAYTERGNQ